jgi:hypothetical protein
MKAIARRVGRLEGQYRDPKVPEGETTLAEFRRLLGGPFTEEELRESQKLIGGDVRSGLGAPPGATLLWKGGATDTHDCAPA